MKPDEIQWNDWMRIFFGAVPPEFYIELFLRACLIYLLLLVSMRLLGKRMAGQLTQLDLVAMVSLASSIGVSMLSPINGLIPPLIIALIIVGITRLLSLWGVRNQKFESKTQGNLDTLIVDGVMHLGTMQRVRLTRERLFAQLRSNQIDHLGHVDRFYIEADGEFSILLKKEAKPGLLILPEWDKDFVESKIMTTVDMLCKRCGEKKPAQESTDDQTKCTNCGSSDWTQAVLSKE